MAKPAFPEDTASALSRHLTDATWEALTGTGDAAGFTFEQAIASGVENPDSSIGVYAGSADSYHAFAALFDPIIKEYHGDRAHREGIDVETVPELTSEDQAAIISTRIRVGRNLADVPLGTAISTAGRDEAAGRIVAALGGLTGDLAGTYYPLDGMSDADRQRLVDDHFLFKEGDRFLASAGLNRDWPRGRGIFHNEAKTFLVWVNEEDQLRIISMQQGGDVRAVFGRLASALDALANLEFARDDRLGYITSCPTNLGTALRASVHVHLPRLGEAERAAIAAEHHVQVRGIHGEHSESEGGIYDISNKRRLGFTETELVSDMVRGVQALLTADRNA